jgi:murein L,D-transpeptidase YafK
VFLVQTMPLLRRILLSFFLLRLCLFVSLEPGWTKNSPPDDMIQESFLNYLKIYPTRSTPPYAPGFPQSRLLNAAVLLSPNDRRQAVAYLEALSPNREYRVLYAARLAEAYSALGKPKLAIPYLEIISASEASLEMKRRLAEAYEATGDFVKAVAEYGKLLDADTDSDQVRRQIVSLTNKKLRMAQDAAMISTGITRIPDPLVFFPPGSRCIIVEKETQTLFLYHRTPAGFELEKTYACSTGSHAGEKLQQGDEKTPEGVYLLRRIVPWNQLPEAYGRMAITMDYPNPVDRMEGRTGDGIWLHATNERIRAFLPNRTRGCVVLSNNDIQELSELATLNETPFVIVSRIRFQTDAERELESRRLKEFLFEWRGCWEDKQLDRYISLYSSRFRNGDQNLAAWRAYKDMVFSASGKIRLNLELQSIVQGEKYAVLRFRQDYQSDRMTSTTFKRLFVAREDGAWKIVAEEIEPPVASFR